MNRVAVLDVGSNTIRLLVAERAGGTLVAVRQRRGRVGLGADIEKKGAISEAKLDEAAACAGELAAEARALGSRRLEVIVTSPGRQAANGGRLVDLLEASARAPARVLTAEEEGALAYAGALSSIDERRAPIAVCDVGGGSTQIAVGTSAGPSWVRSLDVGSLRLTARFLDGHLPEKKALAAARVDLEKEFAGLSPPLPRSALAVGGSARALAKLVGPRLGTEELDDAVRILRRRSRAEIAKHYGVDRVRVRTLAAGALILAEVQHRLVVPLEVVSAGLREGFVRSLLAEATAA